MLYRRGTIAAMEYKGIQFTVHARLGQDKWIWTILPKDGRPVTRDFIGTRERAIEAAHSGIDRLLGRQARPNQDQ